MLEHHGFSDLSSISTPLASGVQLSKSQCPVTDEDKGYMKGKPYAQLLGSLMYLAVATHPDIAYAVGVLACFTSNPGKAHWQALKHLCCYLQGTKDMKLCYAPDPQSKELFVSYSDADLGGNPDNEQSTSGMVIKMGTGAISWASST